MERTGLHFTLVTGDQKHHLAIAKGLSGIPIKTKFHRLQDCEKLMDYLSINYSSEYHIVMLDMDDPVNVGMECLKAVRAKTAYNNLILIAYSRVEDEEVIKKIFIEGANIFFKYPKTASEFDSMLRQLIVINWRVYSTGSDRQHFVLRM
ncbi:hypothetical protein QRD02_07135 [Aequorivita sp. SDUM287046]|uniref:Response regulator n=1 Tax=Aequorivita aurantiaca TaxID=3053356 RepID=A0ABT8DFN1_9FLAO|nr:hypothetical protein [Aequorivita aurantiaca]MDN3724151.1 hypothetical protein [Aequorivita aurantiaca]